MTVTVETDAPARTQPAAKKVAKKKKKAAAPAKVKGIGRVGDKFEVMLYLGSFATVEEAVAVREKGLAFKATLKAAPRAVKKKR